MSRLSPVDHANVLEIHANQVANVAVEVQQHVEAGRLEAAARALDIGRSKLVELVDTYGWLYEVLRAGSV